MITRHARSGLAAQHARILGSRSRPMILATRSYDLASGRQYVGASAVRPPGRLQSQPSQTRLHERNLATAVDDFRLNAQSMPGHLSYMPPAAKNPHDIYMLNSTGAYVTIPDPPSAKDTRPQRTNGFGIPGDIDDMLQVFDACIQVHKFDRAAQVLKRLDKMPNLSFEQRISLHNSYLRACLQAMRTNPEQRDLAESLHKWYEIQIKSNNLPHTAETIACMLKASLLSVRGQRLGRLVKRYMDMAPGESGLRVLGMADILSDEDLAVITNICPTYNFTAEPEADEALEAYTEVQGVAGEAVGTPREGELAPAKLPELIPTPQRGEGLASLKQGIRLLEQLQDVDMSKLTEADRHQIQLQLERDSIDAAVAKWRSEHKNLQKMGVSTSLQASSRADSVSQLMATWLVDMEARIKQEVALVEASEAKEEKSERDLARCLYGPIMRQADPARLAAICILTTVNLGSTEGFSRGITLSRLTNAISSTIQEDLRVQKKEKAQKMEKKRRQVGYDATKHVSSTPTANSKTWEGERLMAESLETEAKALPVYEAAWSIQLKIQVASILLSILLETAKTNVVVENPATKQTEQQLMPAFTHRQIPKKGKKVGVLVLHSSLTDKLKREPVGDYLAKHLPMIVEPKPWKKFHEGGLLDSKVSLVRLKSGEHEARLYTDVAIERGDLDQVFKGLDVLGKTAWKVNGKLLNVMVEAWNTGEAIANLPPLLPNLPTPPEPDTFDDPLEKRKWLRAIKMVENERSSLHSQRCYMNLQLEIARTFRNQTLYFPHNTDYRGRAYPISTYLNHMGADHTRAILMFDKGKELGASGLRWLKIHLANLYGLDKASFSDREGFAMEHLKDVIDSATRPLDGERWWLSAEDPWQCLTACFELKAAMELEDPTKYVCHLPIHQDGTCNGLQHYAALGGDSWGAKQVNLEPGDKPADVYSAVADLVKQSIADDAAADNPFAKALEGKITRKVVKQTVMTNVYGVTFAGAKKQICKQIDALYPNIEKETGFTPIILSTYISKLVFTALATMFRGAHDIQYWLGEVGGRVCRALTPAQLDEISDSYTAAEEAKAGKPRVRKTKASGKQDLKTIMEQFRSTIVWTTPLKLPVVQPYRKSNLKEVRTCLQALFYPMSDQTDAVNRKKQLQAFPPNFIHSLDASHMLLSAMKCNELGLEFAAVHDSFWTHASDVDAMNGVIRDSFIQIHEDDVVGRLATEFAARHHGSIYLAHIDPRTPIAKKILELRKMSQLTPMEELMLEHKRNLLRLSGNPWDLEAAKKIITPASVYEEMNGEEMSVDVQKDIKEIALGEISDLEPLPVDGATAEKLVAERHELEESDEVGPEEKAPQLAAEGEEEGSFTDNLLANMELTSFEARMLKPKRVTTARAPHPLQVWLPLTIPAVPKKGDFDVTRLRESKYFFS